MNCPHCNHEITENEDKINRVIQQFNWDEVHKTMTALDWVWRDIGTPCIDEMKRVARKLLMNTIENGYNSSSTGGFKAEIHKDGEFTLSFVVTESTSNKY